MVRWCVRRVRPARDGRRDGEPHGHRAAGLAGVSRRSTFILARYGAKHVHPRASRGIGVTRASPGRDLVRRHVDVLEAAGVELRRACVCRRTSLVTRSRPGPKRTSTSVRESPSAGRCRRRVTATDCGEQPQLRRQRLDEVGGGDEALGGELAGLAGRTRRRSTISRYSTGWASSTSRTRPSTVDDAEAARRGPGTWRPACARGARCVAELGNCVVTRASATHGIASSSRSARSVSARSTGVPSSSSTTACSAAGSV